MLLQSKDPFSVALVNSLTVAKKLLPEMLPWMR
jgi:hypothetical protein